MEKLNISKILKDCPRGIKLYSAIHGECILDGVYNTGIHIKLHNDGKNIYSFNEFGQYGSFNSECLLFPSKKNRNWSTFQPFKEGDILYIDCNDGENTYVINQYIFILKQISGNRIDSYCYINGTNQSKFKICWLSNMTDIKYGPRFATEEEKEKLFDAIKANGYKWNAETKTLEKLVEPKFKVGDRIRHKTTNKNDIYEISKVYDDSYGLVDFTWMVYMKYQDDYELVPNKFDIATLKPFDKVLTRDNDRMYWAADIYSHHLRKDKLYQFLCIGSLAKQCIPFEDNKHLLGTTNDCDDYYKTW